MRSGKRVSYDLGDEEEQEALFANVNKDFFRESALLAKQFKGRCNNCGKIGHKAANCPANRNSVEFGDYGSKFKGICYNCKQRGHQKRFCKEAKKGGDESSGYESAQTAHDLSLLAVRYDHDSDSEDDSVPPLLVDSFSSDEDDSSLESMPRLIERALSFGSSSDDDSEFDFRGYDAEDEECVVEDPINPVNMTDFLEDVTGSSSVNMENGQRIGERLEVLDASSVGGVSNARVVLMENTKLEDESKLETDFQIPENNENN